MVNYEWNFEQFNSFIRSLDFDPIPNNFIHPKSYVKSREFYFRKIVKSSNCASGSNTCGQVVGINEAGVDVKIGDSVIRIIKILNDKLVPIKISRFADSYNFDVGDSMWS